MPVKLRPEEIVTIQVLSDKGVPNTEIARQLGITEGTVRYHVRRAAEGALDGRRQKLFKAAKHSVVIDYWFRDPQEGSTLTTRAVNVGELFDHLVLEHGFAGTYRGLLRYIKAVYPAPKIRPYRRVETPAGAQGQADWTDFPAVNIGDGPQRLHAFVLTLSHSRKEAVVWCRRMDQISWHHGHNEALKRLQGVPAVIRIDNLKTGVANGAGPWGELNVAYKAYAKALRFHVDVCRPRSPEEKGKVERRAGAIKQRLDPSERVFSGLDDLQRWSDEKLDESARRRKCPATGKTVQETWEAEKAFLKPLPLLPSVFDVAVTRPVHKDCTVNFENRTYSVPFVLVGRQVEVRGCAEVVQVVHEGQVMAEHRRHTEATLVIDPRHYEGKGDERVSAPVPLGRMGRKLAEILEMPVERRPIDLYAALAEVAR
jgi:transposase